MTRQRIRRGVFRSIADLQTATNAYLAEQNANPESFSILAASLNADDVQGVIIVLGGAIAAGGVRSWQPDAVKHR
jgi:hypothetical protein